MDDDDGDDDSDDVENKEELGHYWHTREGKPGGDHPGSHYNTLERASRAAAQAVASPASVGDLPKQIQTKVADCLRFRVSLLSVVVARGAG